MTKEEASLLHTVVTEPFGPRHCVYHTCRIKGAITAAPVPPCQSLFCPPPTLTHLVLVSWVARELARLCTWPVLSSPPSVTDISTAGCANVSSWMGDQISSFRLCLHKEAPAHSLWNWQFRRIGPNILVELTSSAHSEISPENSLMLNFKIKSNQFELSKRLTQLLPLYHMKGVDTVHNPLPISTDLASTSYGCSWSLLLSVSWFPLCVVTNLEWKTGSR
jgi:hypothetical protein